MGSPPVPIWTVPFRRNPFFTGREEVFDQLYTELHDTSITALSQPAAMSGLGGIGKTQTAVEYTYRHRDEYQVVCWIKSSTSEELAGDFASLAQLLHLPERQVQEQAQMIIAVKRWLEIHSDWLLIFDNADDLTILADYLPQGSMGHVIITTRAYAMGGIAAKIEMHTMKREEGIRLLLQRAKLIESTTPLERIGEADLDTAESIFHELGGLPLALTQAGAYIEETGESLSGYLLLFEEQRAELLQWRSRLVSDHAPVATTWTLAFHNMEDNTPDAIELINLLAFLAPDGIPEELLTGAAHLLTPSLQALLANQTHLNKAIKELLTYSLIQRDRTSKTLSIHRLVQAVIKDEMGKTKQARWAEYVVLMISHMFPFEDDAPWTQSQCYLSHALLAVEYIKYFSFTFDKARTLLNALGIYFQSRGQYREAEPFFQEYRTITEKRFGPEHPATATSLNNLAGLYTYQGKYEQAEPLIQRALAIRKKRLGPDHLDTATCLDRFANFYQRQGGYVQANHFYQRAINIFEQRLGSDNPKTMKVLEHSSQLHPET